MQSKLSKVIILGNAFVGKTKILNRYIYNYFKDQKQLKNTVGVQFLFKKIIREDNTYKFLYYDTAGQQQFYSLNKIYFLNVNGVIIVFDLKQQQSLIGLTYWLQKVKEFYPDPNFPRIILANKVDLTDQDSIKKEKIEQILGKQVYRQVSAKSGSGIEQAFEQLQQKIIARLKENKRKEDSQQLILTSKGQKKSLNKRCC